MLRPKELEVTLGYRYEENPECFEYYRADVYHLVQQALEQILPDSKLVVYPALYFKGFVLLDPQSLTAEEIQLYHEQRNYLLMLQARQDIKRSEL